MKKEIIGRVNRNSFSRIIDPYIPNILEQIPTAKKIIREKFKKAGYNEDDIIFEEVDIP